MKKIFLSSILCAISCYGFSQIKDSTISDLDSILMKAANPDVTFTSVQIESAFKGGTKAWSKFIEKHLDGEVPKKIKHQKENILLKLNL